MIDIKEGAFIYEKKISGNKKMHKLMFCSDTMPLRDFERIAMIFRSRGFEPFLEAHPKYGSCIVIKEEIE